MLTDIYLAVGRTDEAIERFADFGARHQYGLFLYVLFLQGRGREKKSRLIFEDMARGAPHLSSRERRDNRAWM